ncbi:TN [Mytilus edulis]|uniref:TN n=1 Tax=Mytilus edulis TaxID=6550 RepID=A0A8S3VKW6_MYTED|nr:TN [Mytilus edulis]
MSNGDAYTSMTNCDEYTSMTNGDTYASMTNGDAYTSMTNGDAYTSKTNGDEYTSMTNGNEYTSMTKGDEYTSMMFGDAYTSMTYGDAYTSMTNVSDIDMTQQHRNNYFKLVALIVDVAYLVISKYIKEKILGPDSFETFLNKEKHKLVHIYETSQCCECRIPSIKKEKLISRKQLLILYKSDEGNQIRDHKKYAKNKLTQICICEYSAKAHIDVRVVDITLANYIIQKCGKHALGIDNWIEQIKDVRNEIFHLSDIQEMTDQIFGIKWTKLEGSIMGIAKEISSDYADEAEKHIMQTQKLTIIGDYMLKYEIICRDYWRNKCAEFERAQNQVIEEKAAALHHTMPKLFSRSMEKECHQTMRKIQTLDSMVNKINVMVNIFGSEENVELFDDTELVMEDNKRILIPVFMQLDIPTSWDKTKVFEAIDEFRLTGTPDMNIRIKAISIDDLNMYAEIAKQVLGNVHELRSEINKLMSTMLSDAEIDTMENAELCVNLNVPDRSAPRKFDIVECTDCSITIEWSIVVPDECISYELHHRPQGTNDWSVRTFYHEDVLKGEDEQHKYQLQNLVPETYYECKLRSVCNHVKSNFSESLTKQTLIQAPRKFDIVECTDCSITIEWFIDVQDECLSYELDHRPPQGTDNLPVRTFSSKDVVEGENGRRMYTLQNLLPETYYEFKLRSVYKDAKSHYSESKTKQTLKLAPRQFDIGECTDCSIIIEWYINDQDDCLSYEIAHRP